MILWIIVIALFGILLLMGIMVWIRKIRFDAIQANFWELKEDFSGQIPLQGLPSEIQNSDLLFFM